jgi:hypothetical protein
MMMKMIKYTRLLWEIFDEEANRKVILK